MLPDARAGISEDDGFNPLFSGESRGKCNAVVADNGVRRVAQEDGRSGKAGDVVVGNEQISYVQSARMME